MQLSLREIPALCILGDSLADEVREIWATPTFFLDNWNERLNGASQPLKTDFQTAPFVGDFYTSDQPAA